MLRMAFTLREQKALSRGVKRYVHRQPMFTKFQDLAEFLLSLTPDDYIAGQQLLERALDYPQFCYELYDNFKTYGPHDRRRPAFSQEACYRTCAAILLHFDLATDDPQQVETADVDDAARLARVAATVGRYVRARRPRR